MTGAIAMAEPKTKLTNASVDDFLGTIENDQVRDDCRTIKGCVYIKRLSDVHMPTLTKLVKSSVAYARKSQPS